LKAELAVFFAGHCTAVWHISYADIYSFQEWTKGSWPLV